MPDARLLPIWSRYRQPVLYGLALAAGLFALRWLELRFMMMEHALELYVGAVAVGFTGLGIWLALKLTRPRVETRIETRIETVVVERPAPAEAAAPASKEAMLARLGLSAREGEVLAGMAQGLSNQEIADRLFVSLNTVKTHSANLFAKLEVKRRTQAVEAARRMGVL